MKVSHKIPEIKKLRSPVSHNTVANQFKIRNVDMVIGGKRYTGDAYQSYQHIIAFKCDDFTVLDDRWDYSVTTTKYLRVFLGISLSKKDIQARINSGHYKITDLNTM